MSKPLRNLVLILGDQVSPDISALKDFDPDQDMILMAEVLGECTYVRHHPKKIVLVLSAMRHFAETLRSRGLPLRYVILDDPDNSHSLIGELTRTVHALKPQRVIVTHPGEYRVLEELKTWAETQDLTLSIRGDDRFICSLAEFDDWAEGRKSLTMEYFYRSMRAKTGLLMEYGKPIGGQWNFDKDNRKPPKSGLQPSMPPRFQPDHITKAVMTLVDEHFQDHFGSTSGFIYAVTKADAEKAAAFFMTHALPRFGDYQDAMLADEPYVFHSLLAPYLNIGLLAPLALCQMAEQEYLNGQAPLNAVEGFIRQILGWREYVRGLYWRTMPDYFDLNFFEADRPLPELYWTGETDMYCLSQVITQTRDHAYAHHIQRLMVTGNFALLAGLDPKEVNEWYLLVYSDAYEWVQLPNTHGMALFADGGIMASKPYAASGKYINKMSDYCKSCRYDPNKRTGDEACPFNALYWDFLARNRDRLKSNHRLGMIYKTYDRFDANEKTRIAKQAKRVLDGLVPDQ